MILSVILIPVIAGILVLLIPFKKRSHMEIFLEGMVILNSILVWTLLVHRPENIFTLDGHGIRRSGFRPVAAGHAVRL